MSEKSIHKFVHEGYGTKVKITTNDVSLSSILETFTHYLKACGFGMDGRSVEAVLDEPEQVPYSTPSVRDAISLLEDVETPDSLSDYHQEMLLDEVTRLFNGSGENDTHRLLAALLNHRSASLEAVVKLRDDLGVIINSWPGDENEKVQQEERPIDQVRNALTEEELEELIEKARSKHVPVRLGGVTASDKHSFSWNGEKAPTTEQLNLIVKGWLVENRTKTTENDFLSGAYSIEPVESFTIPKTAFSTKSEPSDECPLTWNEFRLTEEEIEAKKAKSDSDNFFSPQCKL
jgi:hypothetical protein